jgi:cell division protein FtsL
MIMHWQQWYFAASFVISMLSAGISIIEKPLTGWLTAAFTVFAIYVLYSAGFFTGGM